jgi:hypothetical protein
MTKLISAGDSMILGSELGSSPTYPALVAKMLHMDYDCLAIAGTSNDAIRRTVMNYASTQSLDIVLVVQWTFFNRYEFRLTYDTEQENSPWYSINAWNVESESEIKRVFQNKQNAITQSHLTKLRKNYELGINDFAKMFFKHTGSEYTELYSTLKEIVFLQYYLDSKNIPYIFTSSDSSLFDVDYFTLKNPDLTIATLYNEIKWDRWFKFPSKSDRFNGHGFYNWAIENNYPIGITHPLAESHCDAANLMKDCIYEMG